MSIDVAIVFVQALLVVRCAVSPKQRDLADLATMLRQGPFHRGALLHPGVRHLRRAPMIEIWTPDRLKALSGTDSLNLVERSAKETGSP